MDLFRGKRHASDERLQVGFRRPRIRLTVRTLMLFVLILAGGLGWVVNRARVQREAVAAVRRAGGSVSYDWEWANGRPIRQPQTGKGPTVVECLGEDYFSTVVEVVLVHGCGFSDVLHHIGRLRRLEKLILGRNPGVTDDGMASLRALVNLKELYLGGSPIGDAGLAQLKSLSSLLALGLDGTFVSDAGLVHLEGMSGLRVISLSRTGISDAGLVHLKSLTALAKLQLDDTRITGAGLVHLKGLTQLESLDLGNTEVNDEGLTYLREMANLRSLSSRHTTVGDNGLICLERLTALEFVDLNETELTANGSVALRKALPDLHLNTVIRRRQGGRVVGDTSTNASRTRHPR